MIRRLLYLVVLLAHPIIALAQDYRDANWGMSQKQVRALEQGNEIEEQKMPDASVMFAIKDNILGLPATATYTFVEDKLVQGTTLFRKLALNDSDQAVASSISHLLDALEKKYGNPKSAGDSNLGTKQVEWQTPASDIIFTAGTADSKPFAMVLHYSRRLVSLRLKAREIEAKRKL